MSTTDANGITIEQGAPVTIIASNPLAGGVFAGLAGTVRHIHTHRTVAGVPAVQVTLDTGALITVQATELVIAEPVSQQGHRAVCFDIPGCMCLAGD